MTRIVNGVPDEWLSGQDFYWAVASEKVPGVQTFNATGANLDVDTGVLGEEIWSLGTPIVYPDIATPESGTIVSDNINDDLGGTGVNTVLLDGLITGIDPVTALLTDGIRAQEIVNMNGTTPVALANDYSRIFSIRAISSGSLGTNAGTITAALNTSGTQAQIIIGSRGVGEGVSRKIHRTIPANFAAVLRTVTIIVDRPTGTPQVQFFLNIRLPSTNTWSEEIVDLVDLGTDTQKVLQIEPPSRLPPLTDIVVIAVTNQNNTGVEARLGMTIERIPPT